MSRENQIPDYLTSSQKFISHRLKYSETSSSITTRELESRVFSNKIDSPQHIQRATVLQKLERQKSDIVIVTATVDRPDDIVTGYKVLADQTMNNWQWLIVDNGKEEKTEKIVSEFKDPRINYVKFLEENGCAHPTRNIGLDIVHLSKINSTHLPFVLVIDSDDRLFDKNSLHELFKITKSEIDKSKDISLVHGYSATEIHEPNEPVIFVPNPRDLGSDFPKINNLKEVFDKGLNILAGMFPIELLRFMRYPKEFSFEDDGFNQKLLLQAKRLGMVWVCDEVPTTVKIFHQNSMSGKNNNIGNVSESGNIGLYKVTGIRARIVSYLHDITDHYTEQEL